MNWKVKIVKRSVDVLAASIGLVLGAPLFVLIGAAVKLDSSGPVLYRQRRAGLLFGFDRHDGAPRIRFSEFEMPKFRTMQQDAEKLTGAVIAQKTDARVTRVGRWLRRTRLDELPQLWCVLIGEMSLVGPRPERPEILRDLALAIPFFEERMRGVKPGLTGLAQVKLGYDGKPPPGSETARLQEAIVNPYRMDAAEGATADGMRIKLLYDLAYSATLDDFGAWARTEAGIIARTPLTMLLGKGY
jgi:lipopolysaccharide/colanic/teichoic acid biosynthesis glycosyltransferase